MSSASATNDKAPEKKGLAVVPVALTVLATVFAGMSSSEMTRSMYYRSLAAQYQAKAGDQWGLFQAKKTRGSMLDAFADLSKIYSVKSFDESMANQLRQALDRAPTTNTALAPAMAKLRTALSQEDLKSAYRYLTTSELPPAARQPIDRSLDDLLKAIRSRTPESKTVEMVASIQPEYIDAAIEWAEIDANAFDQACEPFVRVIRNLQDALNDVSRITGPPTDNYGELKELAAAVHGGEIALRFASQDFTARRYDREAKFNQQIGELYEAQIRRAGFESERHRLRSKNFFYAMLCAQAGVTIASMALAKSRQSAFWFFAGLAGLAALVIGGYVYWAM